MTLNEAIRDIQENETLSADARNALHGALDGHPWCVGKDLDQRKLEVRFAIAGRGVHAQRALNVERASA
jgi:hypothetical protein